MAAILLTGGSGFVGTHLRAALEGQPVVLLGRREPDLRPNESWRHADMAGSLAPEILAGGDVLCHLAYSMQAGEENVVYNRRLLGAVNANPGIRRVVLMSSVSVYGTNYSPIIDEDSPCRPVGGYARTKLACENLWLEGLREDCELTVLRPTEIVGTGGRGMRSLLTDALDRPARGAIKRGLLRSRSLHYVAVSNVAAAVLFCLRRRQGSARELFIVSDDHRPENESYAVMQDFVRKLSGKKPLPSVPVPGPLVILLGKLANRPLGIKQSFDSRRIHAAGFEDAVPLSEEVRRMVQGHARS